MNRLDIFTLETLQETAGGPLTDFEFEKLIIDRMRNVVDRKPTWLPRNFEEVGRTWDYKIKPYGSTEFLLLGTVSTQDWVEFDGYIGPSGEEGLGPVSVSEAVEFVETHEWVQQQISTRG